MFDSELRVVNDVLITPGSRWFLLDLDAAHSGSPHLLASACRAVAKERRADELSFTAQGVGGTPAVMLIDSQQAPSGVTLAGTNSPTFEYSVKEHLAWVHFENDAVPRELTVHYAASPR